MRDSLFIERLKVSINQKLPGYFAQSIMEPPMRNTFSMDQSSAKRAAVLLQLYFETEWKFILIKRAEHLKDKHRGQIGFPGGSLEHNETSEEAAIRESFEEISMPAEKIEILGKLSDLFVPVSQFIVHPHVAFVDLKDIDLVRQETEVAEILHISLRELMDDSNVKNVDMPMANGYILKDTPVFQLANQVVWGATAMMLSEFKEICREVG